MFCGNLVLDFLRDFHHFNVQSATLSHSFWTSSVLPAASTYNPPLFLTPFGLPPCLSPLQRPIRRSLLTPFGLSPCLPPLQRPIRRSFSSLLDFLRASRRFNVQSAALTNPFWTSSVLPAASTSNPPLFTHPFWTFSVPPTASTSNPHNPPRFHAFAFITFEYFINYHLTFMLEYFIFSL